MDLLSLRAAERQPAARNTLVVKAIAKIFRPSRLFKELSNSHKILGSRSKMSDLHTPSIASLGIS